MVLDERWFSSKRCFFLHRDTVSIIQLPSSAKIDSEIVSEVVRVYGRWTGIDRTAAPAFVSVLRAGPRTAQPLVRRIQLWHPGGGPGSQRLHVGGWAFQLVIFETVNYLRNKLLYLVLNKIPFKYVYRYRFNISNIKFIRIYA